VLVPNDAQMKSTVGKLMKANPKQGTEDVKDALMQHVVIADKNTLDHDIMAGTDQLNAALSEGINSMGGGSITIDGKKVLLDDEEAATVVDGPHKTDNGYVYTISKVLELE
ncbi:MAG: fasciclin domain-containing protein, partial [Candidatus Dependentiae bacterium]